MFHQEMMMQQQPMGSLSSPRVAEALAVVLSNTVVLGFKAQGHHWNVVGNDFTEYHQFFGMIYEDLFDAVDGIAENIRKCEAIAPHTLYQFSQLTTVDDVECGCSPQLMCQDLLAGNAATLASISEAFAVATQENRQGIANDLASRAGMHEKWDWQLKSHLSNA
ncbi:MAG: DNA starvation/stationary phase protection protein [Betaproteobacteria bacterium]|nr:DNA starvation/stationary phase protection protein [Microbacteriaceae bacterium]NCA24360.1 DNA starvation/stationary phase protection protein [Betaproteobacteria bacterium]